MNTNPRPIRHDRVQYTDILPQKTHVTFVLNDEPTPPPLSNKRRLYYIKISGGFRGGKGGANAPPFGG